MLAEQGSIHSNGVAVAPLVILYPSRSLTALTVTGYCNVDDLSILVSPPTSLSGLDPRRLIASPKDDDKAAITANDRIHFMMSRIRVEDLC